MVTNKNEKKGFLLVYTRKPVEGSYSLGLGNSIHMAYSDDGVNYKPLNQNYGIVFPSATLSSRNTINEKGLKNPYIFYCEDNTFGILAVRVDKEGKEDEESKGQVLLWTSDDLVHFKEHGLIDLKKEVYVQSVKCQYNWDEGIYEILWRDLNGNYYKNILKSLEKLDTISLPEECAPFDQCQVQTNLKGIVPGNIIKVEKQFAENLILHWLPLENISVEVPNSIKATSEDDINSVMAIAVYSDGSKVEKKVDWDTSNIDFSKAGSYVVQGKVLSNHYEFPLAIGYADPQVFKWNGKYYFIATNDNTNAVGLFVREADTVSGLFEKEVQEHIILDYDEKRQLIKTFWAPEFHVIGGDVYILFAVGGETGGPQCHMMKLKKGGNILKPEDWEDPVRVKKMDGSYLTEEGITLDMTYFEVNGISYLVWSYRKGFGTPDDTGSMLYIATIDPQNPYILTSEPVLLSRPLFGWENTEGTINNEGPYALLTKEKVYLAYSGGAAGGYSYVVGWLTIDKDGNLLNPDEWEKSCTPALSHYSIEGEYGPGHNTFFTDEDGNVMIAYHAQETLGNTPRCTGIRRVHFNKGGIPILNMSNERDFKEEFSNVVMNVIVE